MAESTLSSDGRLVIPKPVRGHLHLQPGDRVDFVIDNDGEVKVKSTGRDISELKGILQRPAKAVSVNDMSEAIRLKATESRATELA